MASHTPGPHTYNAMHGEIYGNGRLLATVYVVRTDENISTGRPYLNCEVAEGRANGYLYAASPQLLEACEALLDAVSDLGDEAREEFDESAVTKAIVAVKAARNI